MDYQWQDFATWDQNFFGRKRSARIIIVVKNETRQASNIDYSLIKDSFATVQAVLCQEGCRLEAFP